MAVSKNSQMEYKLNQQLANCISEGGIYRKTGREKIRQPFLCRNVRGLPLLNNTKNIFYLLVGILTSCFAI